MRRLALLLFLLASPAFAQRGNIYSTQAQQQFAAALTEGVLFGVPRYTTVALPICDATQVGALAWNTTTNTLWGCNGTAWAAVDAGGGGGSVTPGVTPFTGCTNQFVIADGASMLNCDTGFTYNAVTNAAVFPGVVTFNTGGANFNAPSTYAIDQSIVFVSAPGGGAMGGISFLTPDAVALRTGTVANSFHVEEQADVTFDFNNGPCLLAACVDPTLIIHSHNQSTTEYLAFRHTGAEALISTGAGAVEFPSQTNISGPDATTNVEIGSTANDANAGVGGTSVVIGNSASNGTGAGNILIGSGAAIAGATTMNIGIGVGTIASGGSNIVLGTNASTAGFSGVVILSPSGGGNATANNQFIAGGTAAVNNVYFGKGVTSTTATAYAINGTGGSGANNAGAALQLAGGLGTGTAAGGDVRLLRSPSIATGSTAQTLADAYLVRSQMKALTAATDTPFVRVNLASGVAGVTGWTGGTVFYTLIADDGTVFQSASGSVNFALVNVGSAEVCNFGSRDVAEDASASSSVATTTITFSTDVAGVTNGCDLRANATSTLTETTLALFYSVVMNGPGTLTPQ